MNEKDLMQLALQARENAYAPNFRVGAALLCKNGSVYTGCNVENASYSPTVCAERVAICKAVSEGEQEFVTIAIVGGKGDAVQSICAPCGVCRQVLAEFCEGDFPILLGTPENIRKTTLSELLPLAFDSANLI